MPNEPKRSVGDWTLAAYLDRNRDRVVALSRDSHLRRAYGISGEVYRAVDHDHETGEVRSLLCNHCNRALGAAEDSPVLLRMAADYLEAHRSS